MFNVVEIETGMAVTVFGVNGGYFLVYDDVRCVWGYKSMDLFRPVKPEDWEGWYGNQ